MKIYRDNPFVLAAFGFAATVMAMTAVHARMPVTAPTNNVATPPGDR